MALQAPKLTDLMAWTVDASEQDHANEVWEIGVPEKNSLLCSIVLSYLYSSEDLELTEHFRKVTGIDEKEDKIKEKEIFNENPISILEVKQMLQTFNPFKSKCASSYQNKTIAKLLHIFDLRIKELNKQTHHSNDDSTLNAASELLECTIQIYFPDETAIQKSMTYPKLAHESANRIVLFQYEKQQHESMEVAVNVFHFGMTVQQAHSRKLDALDHFLRKAKIDSEKIERVKELMNNPQNHGKLFLSTILKSDCSAILHKIYRSPYIALQLSEAGFETNPIATPNGDISPLSYSLLCSENSENFRILYDYAANCRCLFDHSIRRPNDKITETLTEIKNVLVNDKATLFTPPFRRHFLPMMFAKSDSESILSLSVNALNQFILFIEYQFEASDDLKKLTDSTEPSESNGFKFWKEVIESILNNYLKHFYGGSNKEFFNISAEFINYYQLSEYYRSTDEFAFIFFFDNFYRFRLCIDLKQENFLTTIEWRIFIAMISNIFFPISSRRSVVSSKKKCEINNVLRYIPLLHRKVLRSQITAFLDIIKNDSDPDICKKSFDSCKLKSDSETLPQVADELFTTRLNMHIEAACKVSLAEDPSKAILVLQRALQVIGESIKPPSRSGSVASFLLQSCLSLNLQNNLINIRNDLSHYRDNSADGRLIIESDIDYFAGIQRELETTAEYFRIVVFTQSYRIADTVTSLYDKEMSDNLEEDVKESFLLKYSHFVKGRQNCYVKHHDKCMQLLFRTMSDLLGHLRNGEKDKEIIVLHLKAIKYLLNFMLTYVDERNPVSESLIYLLENVGTIIDNNNMKLNFLTKVDSILTKSIEKLRENIIEVYNPVSADNIERFCKLLRGSTFTEKEQEEIKFEMKEVYANNLQFCESSDLKKLFNHYPEETFNNDLDCFLNIKTCALGLSSNFKSLLKMISFKKSPVVASLMTKSAMRKLRDFLTKKVRLLIKRITFMKHILIDEDEEIKEAWICGRSEAIQYHMKFLMRQRYMTDNIVRVSLDMAFFDCANILKSDKAFLEKSKDLFSGISLRNLLSHRTNIPEFIGLVLDRDDFPSTMIDKMLLLIDDLEALESTLELLPVADVTDKDSFRGWMKNSKDEEYEKKIKSIDACKRWKTYTHLFPFIGN